MRQSRAGLAESGADGALGDAIHAGDLAVGVAVVIAKDEVGRNPGGQRRQRIDQVGTRR
jgi:hypothetical protein